MIEAINTLLRRGVDVRRPEGNPHHLKVSSSVSYYPTTGRIVPDGRHALPQRGLVALTQVLSDGLDRPIM